MLKIKVENSVNHILKLSYTLSIRIEDDGDSPLSVSTPIKIEIKRVNTLPVWTEDFPSDSCSSGEPRCFFLPENSNVGYPLGFVKATDLDNDVLEYTIFPETDTRYSVNANSGEVMLRDLTAKGIFFY